MLAASVDMPLKPSSELNAYFSLPSLQCKMFARKSLTEIGLLRVYRRLESIPTTHDEEEEKVAAELAELLGPDRMPFLQLVHQLIVSEEVMQAEQ